MLPKYDAVVALVVSADIVVDGAVDMSATSVIHVDDSMLSLERVSELRRQLPPGGEVSKIYRFESEHGPVTLRDLFGEKPTLIIYSYMFGPGREQPCPRSGSALDVAGYDPGGPRNQLVPLAALRLI
jgi:hypothetical protein